MYGGVPHGAALHGHSQFSTCVNITTTTASLPVDVIASLVAPCIDVYIRNSSETSMKKKEKKKKFTLISPSTIKQ